MNTEERKILLKIIGENLNNVFNDIKFIEDNHTYLYKPKNILFPSVSSKYKKFEIPFDESIAKFVAKSRGITEQEVLKEWKDNGNKSAIFGTETHKFAEYYGNGKKIEPINDSELGVIEFFNDHPNYIVIAQELVVFNKYYKYAGTIDLILYDIERNIFILADWKTNKDLHKNYKNKLLLEPFQNILDTPLNKYKIQLNLYDMCLEEKGFPISERLIIWLNKDEENNKKYRLYIAEDLKPQLKEYYGNNS